MRASVFVGTSLDGFIARADGGLDWLHAAGAGDHGYDAPRWTRWSSAKPVFVLSSHPLAPAPAGDIALEHVATRVYATGLVQSEYAVRSG